MDKIIKVNFEEWQDIVYVDEGLVAWNYGEILQVEGLALPDGNIEVHFSFTDREGDANVYIGTVKDNVLTVGIPDFIFQKEDVYQPTYDAYAFIYQTDGDSGRTIKKITFTIKARPEPTTDVPEDKKDPFLDEVRQIMTETKEIAQSVRDDADAGKFGGGTNITVDSELSEESTNPVQNKVITAEVIALRERNAELEETIEKLQIKVTTEPSPFHHITDSANMKVVDFGMKGITEQETVSGNQLFDISKFETANSEINNGDGTITVTKYAPDCHNTISKCLPNVKVGMTIIVSGKNIATPMVYFGNNYKMANQPFEITQEMLDGNKFGFYGKQDTTADNPLTISDIMINEGSTALSYEPYVGGMPSPNPEHEEEITLAGVYNEATGRYEHKCCVGNKNFWDKEYASDYNNWVNLGWYACIPVRVQKGATIKVSYQQVLSTGLGLFVAVSTTGIQENTKWLYHSNSQNLIKNSVSIVAETDYIYIHCNNANIKPTAGGTTQSFMQYIGNDLQIEISDTVTDYTPHASQPFTLTSPKPLTMWDNLVKVDGKWYWDYKQLKLVVDGNVAMSADDERKGFRIIGITLPAKWNKRDGFCNQLRVTNDTVTQNGLCLGMVNTLMYIINNSYYDDTLEDYGLANWKAHLNEHPLEIVTYKDESELVPLLDEEQELLHNLETYYGVTNVYNEQGCPISLTYISDPKLYVDQKLLQIQQAMI